MNLSNEGARVSYRMMFARKVAFRCMVVEKKKTEEKQVSFLGFQVGEAAQEQCSAVIATYLGKKIDLRRWDASFGSKRHKQTLFGVDLQKKASEIAEGILFAQTRKNNCCIIWTKKNNDKK